MRAAVLVLLLTSLAEARPDSPGSTDLFRYEAGAAVESFASAGTNFRVWFTRSGANAVNSADTNANGTPDNVEEVADIYEQVLAFYKGLGFRAPPSDANLPDNGGDGRFDVYLLDFGGRSDGTYQHDSCTNNVCIGYSVHENDFAGYSYPSRTYANKVLGSHEFFHAVQGAYDSSENAIVAEGTAVWATEQFDNTLNDFEGFVGGYLMRPDHSLFLPMVGPVDPFSYGSCIFFEFLSEKYGPSVIRELWEGAAGAGDWFGALDGVLQKHSSSWAEAFFTFARWNLFTSRRANPMRGYARGSGYPLVRMEAETAPLAVMSLRVFASAVSYLAIPPSGRAQMDVALVGAGAPLKLAVATRKGNLVSDPILADQSLRVSADTSGADELIVVVANTAQSGESLKPGLCAGDPSEVDSCRAQFTPDMGTAMPGGSSGGCSHGGASARLQLWVLLLLVVPLRRKRSAEGRRWRASRPPRGARSCA